jgi:hypothetical protein
MTTEIMRPLSPGLPPATTDAVNANDVRRFVYTWFTLFEHRAPAARLTRHLAADQPLRLSFPGTGVLDADGFAGWYGELLTNTHWVFHGLSNVRVHAEGDGTYQVGFDLDWQGGLTADSSWPTNLPERRFRFALRQQWRVIARPGDALEDPVGIVEIIAEPQ